MHPLRTEYQDLRAGRFVWHPTGDRVRWDCFCYIKNCHFCNQGVRTLEVFNEGIMKRFFI